MVPENLGVMGGAVPQKDGECLCGDGRAGGGAEEMPLPEKGKREGVRMALADWALSENRGGYTKSDRDKIKKDKTTPQWVYTGIGAPRGGTSGGQGAAAGPARPAGGGDSGADAGGGESGSGGLNALELLNAFLQAQQRARDEAYRVAEAQQKKDYEYAAGRLNTDTDRALQEAYINKMLSLLHLPQDMAAQGLGGGASETTLGSLYNNYGNARVKLENERQRQLAGLLNTHQGNLAQLSAQRASGAQAALNAYTTQLAKLMAGNTPLLLSLSQQGGDSGGSYYRLRRLLGWDETE